MAFSLTYKSILDHNIRNVYAGKPVQLSFRHSTEYPNMAQLRFSRENQKLKVNVLKTSEYRSEYGCLVPRAPAFRLLSRHEVDEITQRVQRPTVASTHQDGTSENLTYEEMRSNRKLKYRGNRAVTTGEMCEITERVNRPTKMSAIRQRQLVHTSQMPDVE